MIRHQAREVSGKFFEISFPVLLRWHLLNLSFVPPLRLHDGQGYRHRYVNDKDEQGHGEGQEQGAGRLGGTAGAQADGVQAHAVGARLEAASKPGRSPVGSASWVRVACLADGAQQKT